MVHFQKKHPPAGARPGTLVMSADAAPTRVRVLEYDADGVTERTVTDPAGLAAGPGRRRIVVEGLGTETLLRALGREFEIHPLALEDVVNVPQRPKAEPYAAHLLLVTRAIDWQRGAAPTFAQVAIFVGADYVLTFEERAGAVLAPVERRLHEGRGPIRRSNPDYLAYTILDAVVDGYYAPVQAIGEYLEHAEPRIMTNPHPATLDRLAAIKSVLVSIRRVVVPQRDVLAALLRAKGTLISEDVRVYLRDTLDHCQQLADGVDSDRELANDLMNTYLSVVGHRTNEVMRVLTVIASIFIPLTFLAGIYGMNFDAMPELNVPWAYPTLLGAMGVVATAMLAFFRRLGWLGRRPDAADHEGPVG